MVMPHFAALVLYAFFVSVVFAVISRDTPRACFLYGLKVFGAFVGVAILLGWIMVPFPR